MGKRIGYTETILNQSVIENVESGTYVYWFEFPHPISTERLNYQARHPKSRGSNSMSGDRKD